MATAPILRELPPSYIAGIGSICFEWAMHEHVVRLITYELLNLGPKHGRVAVRSPRDDEQITMIRQLMGLEGIVVESVDLADLADRIKTLSKIRDLVAHSIWLKHESGAIMIQDLTGSWRPDPKGPRVPKRIQPGAVFVEENDLQHIATAIRATRAMSEGLLREVQEKLHGARRNREPVPQDRPPPDPNSITP